MKAFFILLSFIGMMTVVNAQLLTAAAIIIGAKILIGKGFIFGAAKGQLARGGFGGGEGGHGHSSGGYGGHRGKREAELEFNKVLLEQSEKDVDECAKLLVCTLNSKALNKLAVSAF